MKLQNLATYVGETLKLRPHLLYWLLGFVLLLGLDGRAWAQTAPKWNEDLLQWVGPTACADGSALANCPVSGYRVETAATATASAWTKVADVGAMVMTYTVGNLTAGQHCYRVFALSGTAVSPPSAVACATTTAPPPGAPTLKTVDTVAYEVRWKGWRFALGNAVGTVPLGTPCHETFELDGYYQVDRESVTFDRRSRAAVIVARCG